MNNLRIYAAEVCNRLINKINNQESIAIDSIKEEISDLRQFIGITLCLSNEGDELFKDLSGEIELLQIKETGEI
jgi:hypothetical protein